MLVAFDRMEVQEKVFKNNFGSIDIVIRIVMAKDRTYEQCEEDWLDIPPKIPLSFLQKLP